MTVDAAILERLREKQRQLPETLNHHAAALEFTRGSLAIEGVTAPEEPLFRGHEQAVNQILEWAAHGQVFSPLMLRILHRTLYAGLDPRAGVYRQETVPFPSAEPAQLPARCEELCQEIHGSFHAPPRAPYPWEMGLGEERYDADFTPGHPVEVANRAHHQVNLLHPFDEGSGMVARLLCNWILLSRGYPMLVIPGEDRARYLRCVEDARQGVTAPGDRYLLERAEAALDGI